MIDLLLASSSKVHERGRFTGMGSNFLAQSVGEPDPLPKGRALALAVGKKQSPSRLRKASPCSVLGVRR